MSGFSDFAVGTKGKIKQAGLTNPLQDELMQLIKQGLTEGTGPFADMFQGKFDEEAFNQGVKQPAIKDFQENILPMLNEKFIANNQVGGSGMQRAQVKGATDLQSKLAELMYQAQQGEKIRGDQNRLQGVNSILGKQTHENIYKPGTEGALQGFIKGVGQGVGQTATAAVAG